MRLKSFSPLKALSMRLRMLMETLADAEWLFPVTEVGNDRLGLRVHPGSRAILRRRRY